MTFRTMKALHSKTLSILLLAAAACLLLPAMPARWRVCAGDALERSLAGGLAALAGLLTLAIILQRVSKGSRLG